MVVMKLGQFMDWFLGNGDSQHKAQAEIVNPEGN